MKKHQVFMPLFIILLISAVFAFTSAQLRSSGAPAARTGSPGDGGLTCTGCHGGTPTATTGWLTSNVPVTGYVAGQTYQIKAKAMHSKADFIGFQSTIENPQGTKVGTLTVIETSRTQILSGKWITHTQQGIKTAADTNAWRFNWTAPVSGTGKVIVYAAFMAAVGQNHKVYTSTLELTENTTTSTPLQQSATLQAYPNPATDYLHIQLPDNKTFSTLTIYNREGKVVLKHQYKDNKGFQIININALPEGLYQTTINNEFTVSFVKTNSK